MKSYTRADRVSGLIQRTLSDILKKEISDPRIEAAVITDVEMSKDLKNARIYYCITGGVRTPEEADQGFARAMGYIKRSLGEQLDLRYMPDLKFFYDESFDYGSRIDNLLKAIDNGHEPDHSTPEK